MYRYISNLFCPDLFSHYMIVFRTIFTGIPRYSCPVDSSYTFTPEELATRKANNEKYTQYMRETGKNFRKTITEDTKESIMCENKFKQLWMYPKT